MAALPTFLTPGQRYVKADLQAWRADLQITILQVSRDGDGPARVTYICPGGRGVCGPATKLEAAIAAGEIVPVVGTGRSVSC